MTHQSLIYSFRSALRPSPSLFSTFMPDVAGSGAKIPSYKTNLATHVDPEGVAFFLSQSYKDIPKPHGFETAILVASMPNARRHLCSFWRFFALVIY